MGLKTFLNTIRMFRTQSYVNSYHAIYRHIVWQFRKVFNQFPCTVTFGNSRILVNNRIIANGAGGLANALGYYDANNMMLLEYLCQSGFCHEFFDIGANIGPYTLIAANNGASRVFAFEPHPVTFRMLMENITTNSLENVSSHQLALSNRDHQVSFLNHPGSSTNRIIDYTKSNECILSVRSVRGDSFCMKYDAKPDVIKIDVEGHELSVIKGFGDVLAQIKIVLVEMSAQIHMFKNIMKNAGFKGPYKLNYKNMTFDLENNTHEDHIFINKEHVAELQGRGFVIDSAYNHKDN